jgi:phosphatidylglycerophosphate synthase
MTDFSRRPIAARKSGWAGRAARWLAATDVTPNQISIASVGCAALAFVAFWGSAHVGALPRAVLLIVAAAGCQMRLICNLLDGMVAIEGGKKSADGPFWNEAPDRAADILILVGLGLAAGAVGHGWAAAALAVLTAYVRELGRAEGLPADFGGPLAKPQRMALVTGGALLGVIWPHALVWTLAVLILGTALTAGLRARRLVLGLRHRSPDRMD